VNTDTSAVVNSGARRDRQEAQSIDRRQRQSPASLTASSSSSAAAAAVCDSAHAHCIDDAAYGLYNVACFVNNGVSPRLKGCRR